MPLQSKFEIVQQVPSLIAQPGFNSRHITPWSKEAILYDIMGLDTGFGSALFPAANLAIHVPFIVYRPFAVQSFFWENGAAVSGSTDVGVYNDALALVAASGATVNAGINDMQAVRAVDTALGAVTLIPNRRYWLSLGCSTATTQQFNRADTTPRNLEICGCSNHTSGYSSGLIATAVVTGIPAQNYMPCFGISEDIIT